MSRHSPAEIVDQIDSEIHSLLKDGKLSPLNYDFSFQDHEKTDRAANLKALIIVRQHYRKLIDQSN